MSSTTAEQFDFPLDDDRIEAGEVSAWDELKLYTKLCKEHGGVLSQAQAATLAGVGASTIRGLCQRGHLTSYRIMGLKCLPVDEVTEYIKRRNADSMAKGGRGIKAPGLRDMMIVE